MHILKCCIVRCHAEILQVRNCFHSLFGHILLCQHNGQFLGTVVTEIKEDDHIAFFDASVDGAVDERLRFRIRVVAVLYGLHHIRHRFAFAFHQQVVCYFDAIPTLVTVHGIITSDDAGHRARFLRTILGQLFDKSFAAFRVGVAPIHKAMHECVLKPVRMGNVKQLIKMVERTVYTAVRGQSEQVKIFTRRTRIFVGADDFRIFQDAVIAASLVDLHEVLIHYASGTDIEVSHFGVSHLAVGQPHIFARSLKLRIRIRFQQVIPIWRRST